MTWLDLLLGGLVGLVTSIALIILILRFTGRYGFRNRAEVHHTHEIPVSRLGGVALAGALAAVTAVSFLLVPNLIQQPQNWLIITSSLIMFGLGLLDDLFTLGAKRKLLGQILIASATFFCGIGIVHFRMPFTHQIIDLGVWAWPVTVIWLVAMTNLINLIDGVDGLAGGICLMLMTLLIYVSWQGGYVALIAAGMVGALLGFLRFNFPPARIYLGDGGAYFLGFLIACMTIIASQKGTIFAALAAPLFVLALPIIDTSIAILRRGIQGLPLFRPDRRHLHHRLLDLGHSRRKVVVGLYFFTAVFLVLGFLAFYLQGQYFALFIGIGTLVVILTAGKFDFSREWFAIGRTLGNSLNSRADIRYAISLSQWLALEGTRDQTIKELAEDVVFIARKLGFSSIRIRLEDEEQVWRLSNVVNHPCGLCCQKFCHTLPGHQNCFLEVCVSCAEPTQTSVCTISKDRLNNFSIQAELLAEGWAKAIKAWEQRHKMSVRFFPIAAAPSKK